MTDYLVVIEVRVPSTGLVCPNLARSQLPQNKLLARCRPCSLFQTIRAQQNLKTVLVFPSPNTFSDLTSGTYFIRLHFIPGPWQGGGQATNMPSFSLGPLLTALLAQGTGWMEALSCIQTIRLKLTSQLHLANPFSWRLSSVSSLPVPDISAGLLFLTCTSSLQSLFRLQLCPPTSCPRLSLNLSSFGHLL